jgi:methionine aminopeptidase
MEQILAIAIQCPINGGQAVFRARTLIELIDDSIDFENACLQSVDRVNKIIKHEDKYYKILLNPNPADQSITISINEEVVGICRIEITNSLGEKVVSQEKNCKQITFSVDTSKLKSGVYAVKVISGRNLIAVEKLVITR